MFKFAICNETFDGWKLDDALRRVAEIGYDAVELAPFTLGADPAGPTANEVGGVMSAVSSTWLPVAGLHWLLSKTHGFHLTSPDPNVRDATLQIMIERVELCAQLGGKVLVFGSPQQRSLLPGVAPNEAIDHASDVLGRLVPSLERLGVTLCIEPLSSAETDFINTADEAWELARSLGSPNVKIILDVKAMASEPTPMLQIIDRHLEHTGHFHANDPNLRGPGFGDLDFVPVLDALARGGYDGYVSVEVFNYDPDPETIAVRSLEYLRRCLPKGHDS